MLSITINYVYSESILEGTAAIRSIARKEIACRPGLLVCIYFSYILVAEDEERVTFFLKWLLYGRFQFWAVCYTNIKKNCKIVDSRKISFTEFSHKLPRGTIKTQSRGKRIAWYNRVYRCQMLGLYARRILAVGALIAAILISFESILFVAHISRKWWSCLKKTLLCDSRQARIGHGLTKRAHGTNCAPGNVHSAHHCSSFILSHPCKPSLFSVICF